MDNRFGPEVEEYIREAVEMYAADDADVIFLVVPEKLSTPAVLKEIQRMLADHMTVNGKTDRLIVALPDGVKLFGSDGQPLQELRRLEPAT